MMASYPVKDDRSNPEVPRICDAQMLSLFECAHGSACRCSFNLFGLLCLSYDCIPDDAVECGGAEGRYCDARTPVCDVAEGRCYSEANPALSGAMLVATHARSVRKWTQLW